MCTIKLDSGINTWAAHTTFYCFKSTAVALGDDVSMPPAFLWPVRFWLPVALRCGAVRCGSLSLLHRPIRHGSFSDRSRYCTTLSTSSPLASTVQMSLDSSVMPRGVEDIPEKDLRELAKWFKSRSAERRRLLKRYKTGRQKTEALAARKQVRFLFLLLLLCLWHSVG